MSCMLEVFCWIALKLAKIKRVLHADIPQILHFPKISTMFSVISRYVDDLDIATGTVSWVAKTNWLLWEDMHFKWFNQTPLWTVTNMYRFWHTPKWSGYGADGSVLICVAQKETRTWQKLYNVMMLTRAKLGALLVKRKWVLKSQRS